MSPLLAALATGSGRPHDGFLGWARALLRRLLALPEAASAIAARIDDLQYAQFVFFWVLAVLVLGLSGWFAFRYRRARQGGGPTPKVTAPLALELGVSGFLLASFVAFWVVGFRQYVEIGTPPADTLDVHVTGRQWVWKFARADGGEEAGVLHVPAGRPVRLLLGSRDVIHSFFVPALRIKQDAVPGRTTSLWFVADRPGRYEVLCSELCGAGHSRMRAELVVLGAAEYEAWRAANRSLPATGGEPAATAPTLAQRGLRVAAERGCLRCHTTDGSRHIGPTWRGLWRKPVRLVDGRVVIADAPYLTRAMMDPLAEVVAGFEPVMPSYHGRLEPAEAAALVELIRSLELADDARAAPPAPEAAR